MTKPSKRRAVVAAVFVLLAMGILVIVVSIFTSVRFFKPRDRYYISYDDSVFGIQSGTTVYFNGIKVGRVDTLTPDPENLSRVRVAISVDPSTPVRMDTVAQFKLGGLTGNKVIDLRGRSARSPRIEPGSVIPATETGLDRLERQAGRLVDEAEHLIASTQRVMERAETVAESVGKTSAALTTMVEENRVALHDSILAASQTAKATTHLLDTQVAGLLANTSGLVADLGRIIRGNGEQLRSALTDIRQASRNFKDFSREVRQKPSRLLFSRSAPDRKVR